MQFIAEQNVHGKKIRLVQGDITERNVDAIVNAANAHLQHGGGVAGAIVKKGGKLIQDESNKIGYTPVGTAVLTSAGTLHARHVIHAVGPRMGEGDEDNKLMNAVKNSLLLASQHNLKSISFPAISSGIFGFPKDRCAHILVNQSAHFLRHHAESSLEIIEFCIYDDETLGYFRKEIDALSQAGS